MLTCAGWLIASKRKTLRANSLGAQKYLQRSGAPATRSSPLAGRCCPTLMRCGYIGADPSTHGIAPGRGAAAAETALTLQPNLGEGLDGQRLLLLRLH